MRSWPLRALGLRVERRLVVRRLAMPRDYPVLPVGSYRGSPRSRVSVCPRVRIAASLDAVLEEVGRMRALAGGPRFCSLLILSHECRGNARRRPPEFVTACYENITYSAGV